MLAASLTVGTVSNVVLALLATLAWIRAVADASTILSSLLSPGILIYSVCKSWQQTIKLFAVALANNLAFLRSHSWLPEVPPLCTHIRKEWKTITEENILIM